MMIKKVDISFGGGSKRTKPRISRIFTGSSHFSASQHPPTPPNLQKGVFGYFTVSHQISSQNIDRKILFVNKIKISTKCL